jgi:putative transposase
MCHDHLNKSFCPWHILLASLHIPHIVFWQSESKPMSRKRALCPKNSRQAYHVVSRCCNKDFYLQMPERNKFETLIKGYAEYCGVEVLAWAVLSNHFHLLVEVPPCLPEELPDAELLRRVRVIYDGDVLRRIEDEFARAEAIGGEEGRCLRARARERHLRRMGSLPEFVKAVKQCLSQWYNKRHDREGTLWEGRFHSAVVGGEGEEGTAAVLKVVAAYIDLNPVRAGMVADPKDYQWSSYGAAAGRNDCFSRHGLGRLLSKAGTPPGPATAEQMAAYRVEMFETGKERGDGAQAGKTGIPAAEVAKTRATRGMDIHPVPTLRERVPGLSGAAVIGDMKFMQDMKRSHMSGCRGSRSLLVLDWGPAAPGFKAGGDGDA